MLNDITLGQYYHADSIVHKLDPRIKVILTFVYLIAIFLVSKFWLYIFVAAYLLMAIYLSKVPVTKVLRSIKPILFILMFTFVLNMFFVRTGNIIFEFHFIKITDAGIRQALFMALRLLLLVMGTSILTLTTTPISLTDGIEKLFEPLKVIRFPAHELAMMMSIALRFIPTLMDETDKIRKAQMARGADFETGNVFARAKAMVPILVPLFVSAFRRADELALAMEARCYHGGEGRTRLKVLKTSGRDYIALGSMAVLLAVIIIFR